MFLRKQKPDRARYASHLLGGKFAKVQREGRQRQSRGSFLTVMMAMGTTVRDLTSSLILEHRRGRMQL